MQKKFKYELHCHTSEGSRCSKISASDLVDFYKAEGYAGIVITDHFTGNTTTPPLYTWEERIEYFFENGYQRAARRGKEVGIDVFFGLEWSTKGNHFLLLGHDKEWWMAQKDFLFLSDKQVFDRVRGAGGFVIHAHPFVLKKSVEAIRLFPDKTDAVEIYNGNKSELINQRAFEYAKSYGLLMTGGTDAHSGSQANLCGVETEFYCENIQQLIEAIRKQEAKPFSALFSNTETD